MKVLILSLIFLISLSSTTFAGGNEVGNGGTGVAVDSNTVYLLDLMESGQEQAPYFNNNTNNVFLNTAQSKLDSNVFPADLVSQKISEIYEKDHITGAALITALKVMNWHLIDSELIVTPDVVPTISLDPSKLVAVATRRFSEVAINRNLWSKMPTAHKAALVIHELVYAMIPSFKPDLSDAQKNSIVRSLVGIIFSPDLQKYNSVSFSRLVSNLLPNQNNLLLDNAYPYTTGENSPLSANIFSNSTDSIKIAPHLYVNDGLFSPHRWLLSSSDGKIWDLKYAYQGLCDYLLSQNVKNGKIFFSYYQLDITPSPLTPAYLNWQFTDPFLQVEIITPALCTSIGYESFKRSLLAQFKDWQIK